MPRPPPRARFLLSTWLLALLLGPPSASASPGHFAADAPLRRTDPRDTNAEGPRAPHDPRSALSLRDDTTSAASPDGTRLPGMSGVPVPSAPEDLPLSTGAWVAHGGLALLPLGGVWGATRVGGDTRLGATTAETAAGMLAGYLPSRLLFLRPTTPGGGRWADLEVAAFGGGLLFTPPLAALGTWGMGELAFGRSQDQTDAYLGALGGAAAGTLLAAAVDGLLSKLAEPSTRLKSARALIGLALIGSGATLGYQWAGGGPRSNQHTR
ncbi:hypothetical protein FJV41_19200 [Myxococcus llanfairpwllgwyngyllgogerychwyrndrobwllllantysiliogogogochensis]|uniref:Lipoprotein n=2 Tax=Myxococcus llanfairpwllgwyngyllgogerychwyrndrobwllllantysiliogogogochensis TaxID=2590453 RepID=A0A540X130_9BACT|nr:hypothetical protein FJV41_19200 [Myxococcus llanfairpwllgwyngyllgogerychwyrndrobwllllantysiliogogogochensis]